jgi:hypothetical protein
MTAARLKGEFSQTTVGADLCEQARFGELVAALKGGSEGHHLVITFNFI